MKPTFFGLKLSGCTFEGYFYDENHKKIYVGGEFEVNMDGDDVLIQISEMYKVVSNLEFVQLTEDDMDFEEIEEHITNQIDIDDYRGADYDFNMER